MIDFTASQAPRHLPKTKRPKGIFLPPAPTGHPSAFLDSITIKCANPLAHLARPAFFVMTQRFQPNVHVVIFVHSRQQCPRNVQLERIQISLASRQPQNVYNAHLVNTAKMPVSQIPQDHALLATFVLVVSHNAIFRRNHQHEIARSTISEPKRPSIWYRLPFWQLLPKWIRDSDCLPERHLSPDIIWTKSE